MVPNGAPSHHRQLPSGLRSRSLTQSPSAFPSAIQRSPSQEPLESSTIVEPAAIVTRLVFSVPVYLFTCLGRYRTDVPSSPGRPFSATHFLGHCFGLIPASCSFASSAFPVPPLHTIGFPPIKQPLALEAAALAFGCPRKWGRKRRRFSCPT